MIDGKAMQEALQRLVMATGDDAAIIAFATQRFVGATGDQLSVQMRWVDRSAASARAAFLEEVVTAGLADRVIDAMLRKIEANPQDFLGMSPASAGEAFQTHVTSGPRPSRR